MRGNQLRRLQAIAIAVIWLTSFLIAPPAHALFRVMPDTTWGHIYAGSATDTTPQTRVKPSNLQSISKFNVKYSNFPDWARIEVQAAIDIWGANFPSTVPINVDASWGRSSSYGVLGSASNVDFYQGFAGAPDPSLWYSSALANALAGKDLDKTKPEIIIQVNSSARWNSRGDGAPTISEYDLESVFLHEIAHGLGFSSNDGYGLTRDSSGRYVAVGSLEQPTPFDAYAQTIDGRRLADIPTPSTELASILTSSLVWSGPLGIRANNGEKPKLYTPSRYQAGSSTSHLDEDTFSKTGLNSVMTPSLDPGEIFREPGALLLAMMEDMRNKPPAGVATGLPDSPRNVKAYIGDSAALVAFDPPANLRTAQLTEYVVKNLKTGVEKKTLSSPVIMGGLKNGTSYTFSVIARNALGNSAAVITPPMIPQTAWKSTVLDASADGKFLASTTFNGQPAVAYTDSKSGDLKLATFDGKLWKKVTVDGAGGTGGQTKNLINGPISMCVNGTGTKQTLHIFYTDGTDKDLRYVAYNGKSFAFEIVDGNGAALNDYSDPVRTRSSSDVSVSNACVATPNTIQVFYRDESQGVLLGAVKFKSAAWNYELVDGDRATDGRSTGDVGFHLAATFDGSQTVVLYDSVVAVNQKQETSTGEVRVASRAGTDTKGWTYQALDLPSDNANVFGFDVNLLRIGNDVMASWLASSLVSSPKPDQIHWTLLSDPSNVKSMTTESFGTPGERILLDGKTIIFGCQDRLCSLETSKIALGQSSIRLVTNTQAPERTQSAWVSVKKVTYLLASLGGSLVLLKP